MEHNGVRPDVTIPGTAYLADEYNHPSPPGYEAVVDTGSYFDANLEFGLEEADPSPRSEKVAKELGSMCGDCLIVIKPGSSCPHMSVNRMGRVRTIG